MKYGYLTITQVDYGAMYKGKLQTMATAKCDCGAEIYAPLHDIKSGHKKSCGCYKRNYLKEKNRKDLTGLRFGKLTVLEMVWGSRKDGTRTMARCKCDCGNEKLVLASLLTRGAAISCGCYQEQARCLAHLKDYTGMVSDYGVKLLRRTESRSRSNEILWECECGVCKKIFLAITHEVLSGHTTSCGCNKMSSREFFIKEILDDNNVNYKREVSISDCFSKRPLKFDFAIYDHDVIVTIIEYDGEQHFHPVLLFGGEDAYQETVRRDNIKNTYCAEKNIPLIRIPYYMTNDEIKNTIMTAIYP